jgi:hypothetical protein
MPGIVAVLIEPRSSLANAALELKRKELSDDLSGEDSLRKRRRLAGGGMGLLARRMDQLCLCC